MHILSFLTAHFAFTFHVFSNGLSLPYAPLPECLGQRVLVLALDLLEICRACSVYRVTGLAGLCNKKLIYTPVSVMTT